MNKREQKGITLIALIITIIVMLILVAVTVRTAVNSGLFGHAKDATEKWADRQREESDIGNDNQIGNTVDKYKVTPLAVGDYIDYHPDVSENYMGLTLETTGISGNPEDGYPQENLEEMKWRVLSINSDGTVDIISEKSTTTNIGFINNSGGEKGNSNELAYNNGVFLLNDLCKYLYSNETLGVEARNINLLDIERKLNEKGISARNEFVDSSNNAMGAYGKEFTIPDADILDIDKHVADDAEGRSLSYYSEPTTNGSERIENLKIRNTGYNLALSDDLFSEPLFYKVVFESDSIFFISTRYVSCTYTEPHTEIWSGEESEYPGQYEVTLGLLYGAKSHIDGIRLYIYSVLEQNSDMLFISRYPGFTTLMGNIGARPVVTLTSDIKISEQGGSRENPRTLSK